MAAVDRLRGRMRRHRRRLSRLLRRRWRAFLVASGLGFAGGLLWLCAILAGALAEGCPDPGRAGNEAAVRQQAEQAAIAVRRRTEAAVRAVPREASPSRQGGAEEPPALPSLLAVALLSGSAGLFLGLLVSLVLSPAGGLHRSRSRGAERAFARRGKPANEDREAAR